MATTKEDVLQKAQEFLQTKKWNLTNKFISNHVDRNLPDNLDDEEVTADSIISSWEQIFESCYHAQSTFAAENKPTPPQPPKPNPKTNDKTFDLPDDVKEKLAWIDEQKSKTTIAEKRSAIYDKATNGMTDEQKKRFNVFYKTQPINADTDVDAYATSIVGAYTEFTKAFIGNDAPFEGGKKTLTLEDEFSDVSKKEVKL